MLCRNADVFDFLFQVQLAHLEAFGGGLQVIVEDTLVDPRDLFAKNPQSALEAGLQLSGGLPGFIIRRLVYPGRPPFPGLLKWPAGGIDFAFDLLAQLEPGQREAVFLQQMVCQLPIGVGMGVIVQAQGFTLAGQVAELSLLDGALDQVFDIRHCPARGRYKLPECSPGGLLM